MKRIIGTMLVLAMILSLFPFGTCFANAVPSGGEFVLYTDMDDLDGAFASGVAQFDSNDGLYGTVAKLGETITKFQKNDGFELSKSGATSISFDLYRSDASAGTLNFQYNKNNTPATTLNPQGVYTIDKGTEYVEGKANPGATAQSGWKHYEIVVHAKAHATDDAAYGSIWTNQTEALLYVDGVLDKTYKYGIPRLPRGFKFELKNETADTNDVYLDNLVVAYTNLSTFSAMASGKNNYADIVFNESIQDIDTALNGKLSIKKLNDGSNVAIKSVEKVNPQILRVNFENAVASDSAEYSVSIDGEIQSVQNHAYDGKTITFNAPLGSESGIGVKSVRIADADGAESFPTSVVPSSAEKINMTFFGTVDKETLDGAVTLKKGGEVTGFTSTFENGVYSVSPNGGFVPGAAYTLSAYGYEYSFAAEKTGFSVAAVTLRDAEGNTLTDADAAAVSTIAVKFTDAVDEKTLSDNTELNMGGAKLLTAVTYDANTKTAVIEPKESLVSGKLYTVIIGKDVADIDGAALGERYSYQFMTKAAAQADKFATFTDIDTTYGGITFNGKATEKISEDYGNSFAPNKNNAISCAAFDTERSTHMLLSFDVYRTEDNTAKLTINHRKTTTSQFQGLYQIDGTSGDKGKEGFLGADSKLTEDADTARTGWNHYDIETIYEKNNARRTLYINGVEVKRDSYALPNAPGGFKIEFDSTANTETSKILIDNISATYVSDDKYSVRTNVTNTYADVYFSESIKDINNLAKNLVLTGSDGAEVGADTVIINNQLLRIVPNGGFASGREYNINLGEALSILGSTPENGTVSFNAPGTDSGSIKRVRLIDYKGDEIAPTGTMIPEIGQIQILVGSDADKSALDAEISFSEGSTKANYSTMYDSASGIYTVDFDGYLKPNTEYTLAANGYTYSFTTTQGAVKVTKLMLLKDGAEVKNIAESNISNGDKLTLLATIINTSSEAAPYTVSYSAYSGLLMTGFDYADGTIPVGESVTEKIEFEVTDIENLTIGGYVWKSLDSLKPYITSLTVK